MDERRQYREKFEGYAATAQRDFDRIIATLAGGALGLSVTFIHDLSPTPEHLGRLELGWGVLAATLLFSMSPSLRVNALIASWSGTSMWAKSSAIFDDSPWGWLTGLFNALSVVGIVGGLLFLGTSL